VAREDRKRKQKRRERATKRERERERERGGEGEKRWAREGDRERRGRGRRRGVKDRIHPRLVPVLFALIAPRYNGTLPTRGWPPSDTYVRMSDGPGELRLSRSGERQCGGNEKQEGPGGCSTEASTRSKWPPKCLMYLYSSPPSMYRPSFLWRVPRPRENLLSVSRRIAQRAHSCRGKDDRSRKIKTAVAA